MTDIVNESALYPLKSFAKLMTNGKGKDFVPLNKLIRSGNLKIPRTTAIFNMTPAHYCPALARGLCKAYAPNGKHVCYAMKAESPMRPDVLPFRIKQMKFWKLITAEDFAWQFQLINSLKENAWTKLRLNEAGDFMTQKCVDKADKIAMYLKRIGVVTYCYTHRSDLDYSGVKHLVISGSGFQKEGVTNIFKIVEDLEEKPKGWSVCPMDCRECNKCSIRGNKVVVKRH
jgi:hypothetical protein